MNHPSDESQLRDLMQRLKEAHHRSTPDFAAVLTRPTSSQSGMVRYRRFAVVVLVFVLGTVATLGGVSFVRFREGLSSVGASAADNSPQRTKQGLMPNPKSSAQVFDEAESPKAECLTAGCLTAGLPTAESPASLEASSDQRSQPNGAPIDFDDLRRVVDEHFANNQFSPTVRVWSSRTEWLAWNPDVALAQE